MKKRCVVFMLSLCFLLPGLAFAADDEGDPTGYLAVKLGYFIPNNDDDGLKDFDKVFAIGVAGGTKLVPWFAIELGGDYYKTKGNDTTTYVGISYTIDAKVKTWSVPLTAKFILPISQKVHPFVGVGGGWYWSSIDMDATGSIGGLSADLGSKSQSANGFGYHGVVGVDFNINRNFALGAEIKWAKAELDFDRISDDKINVGGTTLNFVVKGMF
jgi:outer membrane protein W